MNARLTSVEGQRIMSILDDAIQKFGFITLLKKEVLGSIETASTLPDAAIFLALKSAGQSLNLALEKDDTDTIESKSIEVEDTTSNICSLMQDQPSLVATLQHLQVQVGNPKASAAVRAVVQAFAELRALVEGHLLDGVEDERARGFFFTDMVAKSQKMAQDLRTLRASLAEARDQRERHSGERKLKLAKLIAELQAIRANTQDCASTLEKDTAAREGLDLASFTESANTKAGELLNLQKSLEEKSSLNKKKEVMLRKKKARVEKELENWIIKYDQDMEEKENELTVLKQEYERELKDLKETEEAYDKVMKEREEFLAEHRRRELHAKREANKKKRLDEAALVIQRAWKRFKRLRKPPAAATTTTKAKSQAKSPKTSKGLSASPSKQNATKKNPKPKAAKSGASAKPTKDAPKRTAAVKK